MRAAISALLALVTFAAPDARAAGTDTTVPAAASPHETFLDWPHDRLSTLFENVALGTDSLLSGSRNYDAPTGSYLTLGFAHTAYRPRDAASVDRPITRIKLRLPHTQERLQLLVDRGLTTLTRSDAQRDADNASRPATVDDTPFAALRVMLLDALHLRVDADVGARLRIPVDAFGRVRADRSTAIGNWNLLFSETLLYANSSRFQATTQFSFQRPLSPSVAFTAVTDATWRQTLLGFDLSQTATLLWTHTDRTLYSAEAGITGVTRPDTVTTAYLLTLRVRQKLYRDWLVGEVRPQLIYPRDRGFRPVPSLTLQLEAFFGRGFLD
ncbi:MAG: hypothetical protein GC151_04495 [Betaproteobacteria bacterium]|nr:hypothetical protein [Betaproteobacteria bacterium]